MRLGLFGGTFNPIHLGHLHAAEEVKSAFDLKRIYLIPSAMPPHKESGDIAAAADRLEMIRRCLREYPDLSVADVELTRPGLSYTIDTVKHFKSVLPDDAKLYLILGIDAFLEIHTWKFYPALFHLIPFVVVSRPGFGECEGRLDWKTLGTYLVSSISKRYEPSRSPAGYRHPEKMPVYYMAVTPHDISASDIRRRVRSGESIRGLVPDGVNAFIQQKGLYR